MSDNYPVDAELGRQAERIEALEQAHAELAAKVDELRTLMNARYNAQAAMIVNIKDRVALESPAPAPDPVCTCGKTKSAHGSGCLKFESADERWVDTTVPTAEPAPLDNDEGMHTLPAKTAAQERYHEANERHYSNREVEMAAGAFDRAEEVAQELDDWTHLIHMRLNTMSQRIAALESPAPAPDPVCANCGHNEASHFIDGCVAVVRTVSTDGYGTASCNCLAFVPTAEPEPAPLDPIEKTVECTNCGHPVWFIAGENEPHPCTDCGTVNSREQPDIFDEDDVAGIDNYLTEHPGTLDVLEGISRFLGKIDRPEDIDLWEFDCFIAAIRAYGRDGAR